MRVRGEQVPSASRGAPVEYGWLALSELPAGPWLDLMMRATHRADVTTAGRAAIVERHSVVQVRLPGLLPADGESACLVPRHDEFAQPIRGSVVRLCPRVIAASDSLSGRSSARSSGQKTRARHARDRLVGGCQGC